MKLPESIARAEMLLLGLNYTYGSMKEFIVINHILDKRNIDYIKTVLPLAEKIQEADSKFRAALFPHQFYDDVQQSKRTKKFFDKIRDNDFYIRPLG